MDTVHLFREEEQKLYADSLERKNELDKELLKSLGEECARVTVKLILARLSLIRALRGEA